MAKNNREQTLDEKSTLYSIKYSINDYLWVFATASVFISVADTYREGKRWAWEDCDERHWPV